MIGEVLRALLEMPNNAGLRLKISQRLKLSAAMRNCSHFNRKLSHALVFGCAEKWLLYGDDRLYRMTYAGVLALIKYLEDPTLDLEAEAISIEASAIRTLTSSSNSNAASSSSATSSFSPIASGTSNPRPISPLSKIIGNPKVKVICEPIPQYEGITCLDQQSFPLWETREKHGKVDSQFKFTDE